MRPRSMWLNINILDYRSKYLENTIGEFETIRALGIYNGNSKQMGLSGFKLYYRPIV